MWSETAAERAGASGGPEEACGGRTHQLQPADRQSEWTAAIRGCRRVLELTRGRGDGEGGVHPVLSYFILLTVP